MLKIEVTKTNVIVEAEGTNLDLQAQVCLGLNQYFSRLSRETNIPFVELVIQVTTALINGNELGL